MEQSTFRCIVLTRKNIAIMYTLEEIEERGKLHFQMTVVKWIIGFGIIFPILMIVVMVVLASMTNSHPIRIDDIIGILSSIYLSPLYLILMIISTPLMGYASSKAIKKKMMEENAQEESEKREEHYRKMEELLEKMSKDKETT